ncbi:EAL domain-containing protein [bacterium]|nr:EAL domain-containing protein [bacterium]
MDDYQEMIAFGFARSTVEEAELDEFLRLLIMHEALVPYFQPIVDLTVGAVFGYEVVMRGRPPLEMPDDLFPRAQRLGVGLEFEFLCLKTAFRKLRSLSPEQRERCKFFVNVSPVFFGEQALLEELSPANLRVYELPEKCVVLEFSESAPRVEDHVMGEMVRALARDGHVFALDDYGCGPASLLHLLEVRPQFLKLDRALIHSIQLDPYRQHLVKSVVAFASSVDSRVIAEGVEYWEELECLMRLGVRFVQGFLFGMPESEPLVPAVNIMSSMQDRVKRYQYARQVYDDSIAGMVISSHVVPAQFMTCAEIGELFEGNAHLDHIVITDSGVPVGLLTRQHFHAQTTGPYGFPLFQTQLVDTFAKKDLLIIDEQFALELLARLAMDRPQENLYDPVLVVDSTKRYIGTITMKALITRSYELGLRRALDTNPLTGLPGNHAIERWISDALRSPVYTVIYADLDRFKEYNDIYGFIAGDDMIRLAGKVLSQFIHAVGGDTRLGHLGGDDFIIIAHGTAEEERLREACTHFDQLKFGLFQPEHVAAGGYTSTNRQGDEAWVPLVTLSLAVINGNGAAGSPAHPSLLSQRAASVKKKAKELAGERRMSSYFIDRRAFPSEAELSASRIQHERATPLPMTRNRNDAVGTVAGFFEALEENRGDFAARPE